MTLSAVDVADYPDLDPVERTDQGPRPSVRLRRAGSGVADPSVRGGRPVPRHRLDP